MARHELWVELVDRPGNLAALAGDLAACGANIVHLDVHPGPGDTVIDRLVVQVPDARSHELAAIAQSYRAAVRDIDGTGPTPGTVAGAPADLLSSRDTPPCRRPGPAARRPPSTLERLVALADGGLVRLRHLSAGDHDDLAAHHRRCSDATRRHSRFLAPGTLPASAATAAAAASGDRAAADGWAHVALAALVGGDIVGVARYDVDRARTLAHLAVMVEDRHQRRGIGSLLVNELALLASNADVRHLRSVAPTGGDRLQRTLRRAGLAFSIRREGEAIVFDCALPQDLSATA
jgi:GNAT superfamily N-acetyltransferase